MLAQIFDELFESDSQVSLEKVSDRCLIVRQGTQVWTFFSFDKLEEAITRAKFWANKYKCTAQARSSTFFNGYEVVSNLPEYAARIIASNWAHEELMEAAYLHQAYMDVRERLDLLSDY